MSCAARVETSGGCNLQVKGRGRASEARDKAADITQAIIHSTAVDIPDLLSP
jgi:hypothetical protein